MSKEAYVLKSLVHFGSLKVSVSKGTVINVDRKKNTVEINGAVHNNVNEVDMCIRAGFIIPYIEGETKIDNTIKISPKAQEKNEKKYTVEKSDVDKMSKDINISNTKKEVREKNRKSKMKVIRENESTEDVRGLKVITNELPDGTDEKSNVKKMEVINADEGTVVAKIETKASRPKGVPENSSVLTMSNDKEAFDAINGEQGTVVKIIGKSNNTKPVSSDKKLTAKKSSKASEAKAKATAESRKKASEARRAKAKEA